MDNHDDIDEKELTHVTNICLRCSKPFKIKCWKLDDVRFKRLCSACKVFNQKTLNDTSVIESVYH